MADEILKLDFDLEQLNDRIRKFRRIAQVSPKRLTGATVGCMILISQAVDPALESDLAERFRDGAVKKPQQYVMKAITNLMGPRGMTAEQAIQAARRHWDRFCIEAKELRPAGASP